MPLLLRVIRKPRWYKQAWLEEGKAQANAILDLRPQENKLSFWQIEDSKSNLYQVAAAVAAGRDSPANFDYVLFDQTLLTKTGVKTEHTVGRSFHREADKYWHRDTCQLSAENVAEIANIIMEHGTRQRIRESEIANLVRQLISSGTIDVNPLRDRLTQNGKPNWLESNTVV